MRVGLHAGDGLAAPREDEGEPGKRLRARASDPADGARGAEDDRALDDRLARRRPARRVATGRHEDDKGEEEAAGHWANLARAGTLLRKVVLHNESFSAESTLLGKVQRWAVERKDAV